LAKFTGAVTAAQLALLPVAGSSLASQPWFSIANEQNFQQQSRESFQKTDVDSTPNPDVAGKHTHFNPKLRECPSTNVLNPAFSLADESGPAISRVEPVSGSARSNRSLGYQAILDISVSSFDDRLGEVKNAAGDANGTVKSRESQNEQEGSRQLSRILNYCRENNLSVAECVQRASELTDKVAKGKSG